MNYKQIAQRAMYAAKDAYAYHANENYFFEDACLEIEERAEFYEQEYCEARNIEIGAMERRAKAYLAKIFKHYLKVLEGE